MKTSFFGMVGLAEDTAISVAQIRLITIDLIKQSGISYSGNIVDIIWISEFYTIFIGVDRFSNSKNTADEKYGIEIS